VRDHCLIAAAAAPPVGFSWAGTVRVLAAPLSARLRRRLVRRLSMNALDCRAAHSSPSTSPSEAWPNAVFGLFASSRRSIAGQGPSLCCGGGKGPSQGASRRRLA